MALAAGLRVVKRTEAVRNLFDLIKLALIHSVRGVVHHAVGLVVEASGRFGKSRSTITKNTDRNSPHAHTEKKFHEHLEAGQGRLNVTYPSAKTKWKMGAVLNGQLTAA